MDIKHTKGPWKVVRPMKGKYRGDFAIVPQSKHSTEASGPAFCYLAKGREDMQEANARLIAAAPELLEALVDLGDWLAYGLNKAEGAEPTAEDHATCDRVAAKARAAINKATGVE